MCIRVVTSKTGCAAAANTVLRDIGVLLEVSLLLTSPSQVANHGSVLEFGVWLRQDIGRSGNPYIECG